MLILTTCYWFVFMTVMYYVCVDVFVLCSKIKSIFSIKHLKVLSGVTFQLAFIVICFETLSYFVEIPERLKILCANIF